MKQLLELRNKKAELHAQMKQMVETAESEKRSLTTDEAAKFKALQESIQETSAAIERAEVLADNERSLITGTKTETRSQQKPTNAELRSFVQTGEARSLSAAVPADGGYTVIPTLDRSIQALLRENSVFRQNATVVSIASNKFEKLVSVGGSTAVWAAESDERAESDTSALEKVEIPLNSIYSYPSVTMELLDSSDFDIEGWLTSEIALESGEVEESAFWVGNGVKKPKGILDYPRASTVDGVRAFGTIQELETAATGVLDADDLITLAHTLKSQYRQNAKFFMNDSTLEKIRKLKDLDENYLFRVGLAEAAPNTLLGKVLETAENIPDDLIVFADLMRGYTCVDHTTGTRLLKDNITKPGWVKMFATRYSGGGVIDSNAIKILKVKTA